MVMNSVINLNRMIFITVKKKTSIESIVDSFCYFYD